MDCNLLYQLKEKTLASMASQLNDPDAKISSQSFFGDSDIALITHEYQANNQKLHRYDFIEINYVVSGKCYQTLGADETITLTRGNVCIMNPLVMHSCNIPSENDVVINLLMKPELFNTVFFHFFSSNTLIGRFFLNYVLSTPSGEKNYLLFHTPYSSYTDFLMDRIVYEYLSENTYSSLNIQNLVILFFSELLHNTMTGNAPATSRTEEIVHYIATHLRTVTLKETAEHFYMHPNYLSSYIKKHTGKTFAQILSEYRLAQAKHLLLNSTMSINEISNLLGYADPLSFHNMFRRHTHETPVQFRKKHI